MQLKDLISRVRAYTRDTTGSLFTQDDIHAFCNEGLERMKQIIPELIGMRKLLTNTDEINILPEQYKHLVAVYSASRCFSQDEQQYQASTYMNEFEAKMDELKRLIANGDIILRDDEDNEIPLVSTGANDYVKDIYFTKLDEVGSDVAK